MKSMTRLSVNEQAALLYDYFKSEYEKLISLPPEEAKKLARKNLFDAGIIDKDDNFTEPYSVLSEMYVQ